MMVIYNDRKLFRCNVYISPKFSYNSNCCDVYRGKLAEISQLAKQIVVDDFNSDFSRHDQFSDIPVLGTFMAAEHLSNPNSVNHQLVSYRSRDVAAL